MAYQNVFQRYELKYMLTLEQKEKILQAMEPYMALDKYGRTIIRNIYYDTDNYRLIRRSMERPVYKEKLRVRSYKQVTEDSPVFVELKKKYKSVVYKRRLAVPEQEAMRWLNIENTERTAENSEGENGKNHQIKKEIDYFLGYYENLHPVVFLSYEREAYYSKKGDDFRVTFDDRILCREEALSLEEDVWGTLILEEGKVLMEVKTSRGIPLWMIEALTKEQIYKTSFSKYGTAYASLIYQKKKGGHTNE